MEQEISVLIVEPRKIPRAAIITNTDDVFSVIVGGDFDVGIFPTEDVALIRCEANKRRGVTPNRVIPGVQDYVAGTFFLCGFEGVEFCSLTPEQQKRFQRYFSQQRPFVLIGIDIICCDAGDMAKAAYDLWSRLKDGESVTVTKCGGIGNEM